MFALAFATGAAVPDHGDNSASCVNDPQDSFRIVRRLCESSPCASIYLCETDLDASTEQLLSVNLVVLKVGRSRLVSASPSPTSVEPRVGTDSILQEYAVANRLLADPSPHPHIVQFNSVAIESSPESDSPANTGDSGLVVLVMEYCPRGDLFSLLEQQPDGRFTEARALSLFAQIASGVHHLHALGIAHLDISLENVLLDNRGNAKICDFGLSVFIDNDDDGDNRRHSAVGAVGKLLYMAPEVASGGTYDPVLADVWSLGIVLFILLTGSPLFQVARPSDAAWNALREVGVRGILSHWKLEDGISSSTIDLLTSMLRVDASQRPQSLDRIVEAFASTA